MNKEIDSVAEALADIQDGARIAIGGFFTAGVPRALLQGLIDKQVKNLTLMCGSGPLIGAPELSRQLIENGQIKKVIDSYALSRSITKGKSDPLEQAVRAGDIVLEIVPMGTLAERYRAAGAGIAAFYTPTGGGSRVEESQITSHPESAPKEVRMFNGRPHVLEEALQPDIALIHAHTGDGEGNLCFRKTARNFNPVMAMAARMTIAEVENLVEPGGIDPQLIHTPGVYVKKVVHVGRHLHAAAAL